MKTYTRREAAYILGTSERTIAEDCRFLNIYPTKGDRGENLYSQNDFNLISQMREHCQDKTKTRASFVPSSVVEIIDDEPKVSKLAPSVNNAIAERFNESLEIALRTDPLFDLELLQRISDRKWLMPSNRLAPLLGLTAKYLNSKQTYYYCGFVVSKEIYANNRVLWKVESNNS